MCGIASDEPHDTAFLTVPFHAGYSLDTAGGVDLIEEVQDRDVGWLRSEQRPDECIEGSSSVLRLKGFAFP